MRTLKKIPRKHLWKSPEVKYTLLGTLDVNNKIVSQGHRELKDLGIFEPLVKVFDKIFLKSENQSE